MTGFPILSLAIGLPLVGALLLLFVSNRDGAKDALIRNLTLGVADAPDIATDGLARRRC